MFYENIVIPYGKTGRRRYIVDISLPEERILIEVKPESRVNNRNNRAKRKAAEEWSAKNGWEYLIVTDEMIAKCGRVLSLDEASKIDGVMLNERAKRTLKRREARARKKVSRRR